MYIRNKGDLLQAVLEAKHIRPAIKRAITEGRVENLGGFYLHPHASNTHCWWLKITGIRQVWFVRIIPGIKTPFVGELKEPHWGLWEGYKSENPLYQGDKPDEYRELKKARAENDK